MRNKGGSDGKCHCQSQQESWMVHLAIWMSSGRLISATQCVPALAWNRSGMLSLGCLSHSSLCYPERIGVLLKKKKNHTSGQVVCFTLPLQLSDLADHSQETGGGLKMPHHKWWSCNHLACASLGLQLGKARTCNIFCKSIMNCYFWLYLTTKLIFNKLTTVNREGSKHQNWCLDVPNHPSSCILSHGCHSVGLFLSGIVLS